MNHLNLPIKTRYSSKPLCYKHFECMNHDEPYILCDVYIGGKRVYARVLES